MQSPATQEYTTSKCVYQSQRSLATECRYKFRRSAQTASCSIAIASASLSNLPCNDVRLHLSPATLDFIPSRDAGLQGRIKSTRLYLKCLVADWACRRIMGTGYQR